MNKKIVVGIILAIIVLGGGYFIAKTVKHTMVPAPTQQQQTTPSNSLISPTIPQSQNIITFTSTGWSPTTLTIKAGQTVIWINKSGQDATVNSNPHPTHTDYPPLNLGILPDGGSVSLLFPKAGTYGYHDHLNPSETGTIIVQ